MAEKKKSLVGYGMQVLRELLKVSAEPEAEVKPQPTSATIEDIKLDDLKREKVRLEQEERKMLAELRQIESQKRHLFEEGVRNSSEREQRVIARQIKGLDQKAQSLDHILQGLSKQAQIIEGLVQIKERARLMNESGIASVIGNIDLGDLIHYISNASVDGEFHMKKFDEILHTLGQADALSPQISEDSDVLDIVKQMQMAREAADSPEALEKHFSDMNREMAAKAREQDLEAKEEDY